MSEQMTEADAAALALEGSMPLPEAERFLGVKRSKLYELIGTKQLPDVRIGRRRVIPRVAARRFLARMIALGEGR